MTQNYPFLTISDSVGCCNLVKKTLFPTKVKPERHFPLRYLSFPSIIMYRIETDLIPTSLTSSVLERLLFRIIKIFGLYDEIRFVEEEEEEEEGEDAGHR